MLDRTPAPTHARMTGLIAEQHSSAHLEKAERVVRHSCGHGSAFAGPRRREVLDSRHGKEVTIASIASRGESDG